MMKAISEIVQLGYMIQNIWQAAPNVWYVCFRSPFEWERWQVQGESLAEAATKAAAMARQRGPALQASEGFRRRTATYFSKHHTNVRPTKKRIRL